MNILITGASGFIGRTLIEALKSESSYNLSALVRKHTPELPAEITQIHVESIDANTDYRDCLDGIEVIVHAAARVHRMNENLPDVLEAYRSVNTKGTLNLARQAATAGVKRFIFLSSIKVNGESTEAGRPFMHTSTPSPCDPYAISKYEAEMMLTELATTTGLETVILRPSLVYGPGVKANFQKLMQLVYRRIPLPLGLVSNKRSFLYIGNLVSLIQNCISNPAAANRMFLVSDGQDISTPELVRKIAHLMQTRPRLLPIPPILLMTIASILGRKAQLQRLAGNLQLDIRHTMELLDWKPIFSLDAGLKDTIAHFLKQQSA